MKPGILYGISAGPGDPELLTLKGLRLLQRAPVVAFPAGVRGQSGMAEKIIADWLQPHQIQLALNFPYVQERDTLAQAWQLAAERTWTFLEQGQDVAFVSEGDISFYSTFTYLAQTLQQWHPELVMEKVPGVCSPLAAAAALKLPLTMRDQRLAVLPALYSLGALAAALTWADVVVLLKFSSVYDQVWDLLAERQLLDRSYVVERATWPDQVVYVSLRDRTHLQLPYFSLLIVQVNETLESDPANLKPQTISYGDATRF